MKGKDRRNLDKRRRRLAHRLNGRRNRSSSGPVMGSRRPKYEVADRVRATRAGGLGAVHALLDALGLPEALNERLQLLKRYQPYRESDHILSLAYNVLSGGTRLQDLDALREDEALLDMLGAKRLPDPTTIGDFLRRFSEADIWELQRVVNEIRTEVWKRQSASFRRKAVVDADGTLVSTQGEKKRGMDYSYKKLWGYHPLLVSLANTREPLFLVNRPGNVPSHTGAAEVLDEAIDLLEPIFDEILLRGDTDFSLTKNLDRWTKRGVKFVFGFDAIPKLKSIAEDLPEEGWRPLERKPKYEVATAPRAKRENVKAERIEQKEWKDLVLESEHLAEIDYKPGKCSRAYRMVILRKTIRVMKGQRRLHDECRYLFYVTNDCDLTPEQVVRESNERCDQENLIEQLKNGVNALRVPTYDLESNWAYMVIAALAWTFKAWFGLDLPRKPDRDAVLRMEFKRFLHALVLIPTQVLRSGRYVIVRLLAYTRLARLLFRSMDRSRELKLGFR